MRAIYIYKTACIVKILEYRRLKIDTERHNDRGRAFSSVCFEMHSSVGVMQTVDSHIQGD